MPRYRTECVCASLFAHTHTRAYTCLHRSERQGKVHTMDVVGDVVDGVFVGTSPHRSAPQIRALRLCKIV